MVTSFSQLPPSQEQKLRQVIVAIVDAVAPEKIICYGARTRQSNSWSCFTRAVNIDMDTDYDLLIILKPNEKREAYEIVDLVSQYSTADTRLIAIAHSLQGVNEALQHGHPFFCTIYHEGVLVHDATATPLAAPARSAKPIRVDDLQKHWDHHFGFALNFLECAANAITSRNTPMAALMLHHATEHTCLALLKVYLHYLPDTHHPGKLLALTENFSLYPSIVFPQITPDEIALFKTLTEARYDTHPDQTPSIPLEKVEMLRQRVIDLQGIAIILYNEKMEEMRGGGGLLGVIEKNSQGD